MPFQTYLISLSGTRPGYPNNKIMPIVKKHICLSLQIKNSNNNKISSHIICFCVLSFLLLTTVGKIYETVTLLFFLKDNWIMVFH